MQEGQNIEELPKEENQENQVNQENKENQEQNIEAQQQNIEAQQEKEKYIKDNVTLKGYRVDELSTSITSHLGLTIKEISLDTLKQEIEYFKTEQAAKRAKEAKDAKANVLKYYEIMKLYSPEHYEIKTLAQQQNKLTKLNEENKKINPEIVDSHEEKTGGIFGKKITYYFNIKCPELNTEVARTLEDFEFFQKTLAQRYVFKFVPPLYPKTKDKSFSHEFLRRYLNRFLKYVSEKKILRTSPITLEFLELNSNQFYTYKKKLMGQNYICKYNIENYITNKGKLDVEYNKEKNNEPTQLFQKIDTTKNIYKKLDTILGKIVEHFTKLEQCMKEASDSFSALSNYSKESGQSSLLVTGCEKLKDIFSHWSGAYKIQKTFMNNNFKEFFDYINLQIKELEEVQKQHLKIKNDYERYGIELVTKKDKLFTSKKYNLWELSEEDCKKIETFKNDKEKAFQVMLPGNTNLVKALKIQMACSCYIVKKEYENFIKRQGENVKEYLLSLKDKNQEIISEAFALCTLFNIEY